MQPRAPDCKAKTGRFARHWHRTERASPLIHHHRPHAGAATNVPPPTGHSAQNLEQVQGPVRVKRDGLTDCRRLPLYPHKQTSFLRAGMSQKVESRMGAVAWAIRQRSVSHPRSSNRTCPIKASGSPTGFIVRHTGSKPTARGVSTVSNSPSPLDTAVSDGACL